MYFGRGPPGIRAKPTMAGESLAPGVCTFDCHLCPGLLACRRAFGRRRRFSEILALVAPLILGMRAYERSLLHWDTVGQAQFVAFRLQGQSAC
jgi:hypothetical protein